MCVPELVCLRSCFGTAMSASRRKCPGHFTSSAFLKVCKHGGLGTHMQRVKADASEDLFKVDLTQAQDRDALYTYREFLTALLIANSTGIVKATVMRSGLRQFDT